MQKAVIDRKTAICLLCYLFLFVDLLTGVPLQVRSVISRQSAIRVLKNKIKRYSSDIAGENTLLGQKEELNDQIAGLQARTISPEDSSTISAYISAKAKEYSVEILELIPREPQPYKELSGESFFYLPIEVDARAGFHDLGRFLNSLKNGEYFMEVKELFIKGDVLEHEVNFAVVAILREEK